MIVWNGEARPLPRTGSADRLFPQVILVLRSGWSRMVRWPLLRNRTMTHRAAVLVAVLLLGATPASGQPLGGLEPAALRGDSTQTRKRLAEARNKLLLGKHADATDELQRILDESG